MKGILINYSDFLSLVISITTACFGSKSSYNTLYTAFIIGVSIFYMFNSEASTFFLAVDILDRYLQNTKKKIEDKDIHLIGLACIFIASKSEDLCPFQMKHIVEE